MSNFTKHQHKNDLFVQQKSKKKQSKTIRMTVPYPRTISIFVLRPLIFSPARRRNSSPMPLYCTAT